MVVFLFFNTFELINLIYSPVNHFAMSIYLEFPAITEYPLYTDPFKNDQQLFFSEEEDVQASNLERNTLQDYLMLRML